MTTALVFDGTTDQLFAATRDGFFAVSTVDGSATFIGTFGVSSLFGMTWNPNDGEIYGTSASTDSIYIISRTTGFATFVGGTYSLATFGTGMSFATPEDDDSDDGADDDQDNLESSHSVLELRVPGHLSRVSPK